MVSQSDKRPPLLESDLHVLEVIEAELPEYLRSAGELMKSVHFFVRSQQHVEDAPSRARLRLVNHACNDLFELIQGSLHGMGRSMTRSARSLFEVAVGSRDIPGSQEMCDRYLEHEGYSDSLLLELERLDPYLADDPRSLSRARTKRRRESERALQSATAKWGSSWRRNWAGRPLRKRAEAVGLVADYDSFYRFASLPTHATSGGVIGTQASIKGYSVFRFGPALAACPISLIYGIDYFELTLDELGPLPAVQPTHDAIAMIRTQLGDYASLIQDVDWSIWPEHGFIPGYVTVARVSPFGVKWLIHDMETRSVIDAVEPDTLSSNHRSELARAVELVRSTDPTEVSEPLAIAMIGVRTSPKPNAQWVEETLRLPRQPFFAGPPS